MKIAAEQLQGGVIAEQLEGGVVVSRHLRQIGRYNICF